MFSVPRHPRSFDTEIAHLRRFIARADWDARPTFCYRLRATLREALASVEQSAEIEHCARAVIRAAEHFANALRPNFTPSTIELTARIDELEMAGVRALDAQARVRAA